MPCHGVPIRHTNKEHLKCVSILLFSLTLAELGYIICEMFFIKTPTSLIKLFSPVIRLISLILVIVLQVEQRHRGKFSSTPLFLFWFLNTLCGFFTSPLFDIMTGVINEQTDNFMFILRSISYSLTLMQLLFSAVTDPDYNQIWKDKKGKDEYVMEHQPFLSRLLFSWLNRLLIYGYRHNIEVEDIDPMSPDKRSAYIYKELKKRWRIELRKQQNKLTETEEGAIKKKKRNPSLFIALLKTLWPWLLMAAILEGLYDFVSMLPPMLLDSLISFVQDPDDPVWHGFVYALCLFATAAASSLIAQHTQNCLVIASLVPKMGLTSAIYRKALKLSNSARSKYSVGELCNFITVDSQQLFDFMFVGNYLWSSPLRIILNISLLWQYLGPACLAGVAVMLLIMPITTLLLGKIHRLQKEKMKHKDCRLRQMNDILNGIRILKLFAWELPFMKEITDVRKKEITTIKKLAFINAVVVFLWTTAPFLVAIASFVTYVLMDEQNVLDPSIAFVSLTLFNKLRFALSVIPDVISDFIQSRISLRRLESFLLSDEIREEDIGKDVSKGECIVLKHCSFSWMAGEEPFLRDISVTVPEGSLVGVVGQVGSGKSALLTAILGEMHKVNGDINVKEGDIAYVAQQAWIQNATVQDNILFLKRMQPLKYEDVITRCCLREDLKILPAGDQTEIGEKGINLSGGQKQRISLARALYQDTSIYLLDDPLSAVDSHVGAHIFTHVIGPTGALKNKTRVLATNDLSVLPNMDLIVVMANGRIEEVGSFQDLMDKKGEFSKFVEDHQKKLQEEEENDERLSSGSYGAEESITLVQSTAELKEQMKRIGSKLSRTISLEDGYTPAKQKKQRLVEAEKMETGHVKASVFQTYFRYATYNLIALMIFAFAAYQGFEVGSNLWLSQWSSDPLLDDGSTNIALRNLRIGVYGVLGFGQGLCILAASFLLAVASTRASRRLHIIMLSSILRSPMAFFESTPIGRILNRFGKDIHIVDSNLPTAMNKFLMCIVAVIATMAIIASNSPIFIAVFFVLSIFYALVQMYYMATSRQIRRLTSITLSPVMSNFSETVQGTSTIRAFRAEKFFVNKEDKLVDTYSRPFFCATLLNRWMSIRLELMGSILIFCVGLLAVFDRESLSAGMAGLILTYALNITEVLATLVKFFVNLEIRMVAVERISEYSNLPSEAPWESTGEVSLPRRWPKNGSVAFNEYKMCYQKNSSLVLKGINVLLKPSEKVGIVGRTGAGKSSLALALFRIVEPVGGSIVIDGIDIANLGLHDLRSKITIIPQDPVLFNATIRVNLDPLNIYSDDKLWEALDNSHLKCFVSSLGEGLNYKVTSGGENLSVGQRQQLCLARALLKKTKVLVLDEATAAVDMETDRLIQNTIRQEFSDCTIITIAHRLYTILDYDRIIVMENGKIVEEGKPDALLQKANSHFFKLSKDAGLV